MTLSFSRRLFEIRPVLLDPNSSGPDPVYQVFTDLQLEGWVNKTIVAPGRYTNEYPKTFGHYHPTPDPETYSVLSGQGILILQKKHFENGSWTPEKVATVFLIKAVAGDKVIITPEFGHSWSNTAPVPLVLLDDWSTPHSPADYEAIKKLHGLAYYLVEENDEIKALVNPNYQNPPSPLWLTAKEFASYRGI